MVRGWAERRDCEKNGERVRRKVKREKRAKVGRKARR